MSKTILTKEQENNIVQEYLIGKSQNQLAKDYNVSTGTIKRALTRNNIHIRSVQETNISKYNILHDFFKIENQSSDSAYILGLLASDGWVSKEDNCVCIELQQSDKQILEDINKKIKNERPIKDYERANGYKNSKLYFFSQQIKKDLELYDIVPNKTYLQTNFVKNIKYKFFPDFLRGFFDGDGCITSANYGIRWQLDGASILTFMDIYKYLKVKKIDVMINNTTDNTCTIPRYRLYTYSQKKVKQLFDLMYYNDDILKLNRKYNHFLELLK